MLTPTYDSCRFQGTNAGHTLEFDSHNLYYILFRLEFLEKLKNVIGNGVIIDPYVLINKEIKSIDVCGCKK